MANVTFKYKWLFIYSLLLLLLITRITSSASTEDDDDEDDDDDDEYVDNNDDEASDSSEGFEFDESGTNKVDNKRINSDTALKKMYQSWSSADLCKDVQCKRNQYCVIKNKGVAVCISKKKKKANNDKPKAKSKEAVDSTDKIAHDDDENDGERSTFGRQELQQIKTCKPCPVVRPLFVCGSDNSTYSSFCRLQFHNCVHKAEIKVACKGFCPCTNNPHKTEFERAKETRTREKWAKYLNKFNQANKNYKLDKYKKTMLNGKDDLNFDDKEKTQNSVVKKPSFPKKTMKDPSSCSKDDLKVMGTRLLDWFSVVMADQKRKQKQRRRKQEDALSIPDCKTEVAWMFQHLDTNSDMKLSLDELYYIAHDKSENCLKPYLDSCDEDRDTFLSAYEWCTCFDTKGKPCSATIKHSKKGLLGAYVPQCDDDGFYKATQCHGSTGMCWCVDKNGVEFTNTRRRGLPDCDGMLNRARQRSKPDDVDAENDDDDDDGDDEDDDGSGDKNVNV